MSFLNKSLIEKTVNRCIFITSKEPEISSSIDYTKVKLDEESKQPSYLQHIRCALCTDILWKPFTLFCCGYSFCYHCLFETKECPKCLVPVVVDQLATTKHIERLLEEVNVHCTYVNCTHTCQFKQLSHHLRSSTICSTAVSCSHKREDGSSCKWVGAKEQYAAHESTCAYRSARCISCESIIDFMFAATHVLTCNGRIRCRNTSCSYSHKPIYVIKHEANCSS
jgi:hypothetical protein